MASPPPPKATVTLGGKGASLSSSAVYSISHGLAAVRVDHSALDKLASETPHPSSSSAAAAAPPLNARTLTPSESRAALAVLLNKLLASAAAASGAAHVTAAAASRLEAAASGVETPDFASASALLASRDEAAVLEASAPAAVAFCALMDCCASALVRVADAVAALSCEAARADASVFDLAGSEDDFAKDETDVARDVEMLLSGSELVGANDAAAAFGYIPAVHGFFRWAVGELHARVRIELNSAVKVSRSAIEGGSDGKEKEKALAFFALQLATAIQYMCEISFARTKLCANSIADADVRSKLVDSFGIESFRGKLKALRIDSDNVSLLRGVYHHLLKFRDLLAWEAAVALAAIEMDDSIEKPRAVGVASTKMNGENTTGDKKSEKKKRKTLAKGTSAVMELLRDRATNEKDVTSVNAALVGQWGTELSLFFDPKDSHLESLIEKMKEIVDSNEVRRLPKIPKGTHDFGIEQMAIRERAFSIITRVFKMHGAVALDTPLFELRETLMGKYGEDSKLIYDLADQGGELCSLRYDLTVPFARYVAMNNLSALKGYQIGTVCRSDNPSEGRCCGFYQCNFDIAGQYEPMEADFEVIYVLNQLLGQLDIGSYEIKLNHRKLLDGMLEICGVPPEKIRTVCSSINKLDKRTFEQIKKELVEEKGISNETADKIGTLVKTRGPPLEVLLELKKESSQCLENSGSVVALNELEILFKALEKAKALDNIVFDLSLARWPDYYTGVIYEAVSKGTTQVGSIAAGGRYDNLISMFSGKQVLAVGISLGIERVLTIMEQLEKDRNQETPDFATAHVITATAAAAAGVETSDFASASALLASRDEAAVLAASAPPAVALCAMLDCSASGLVRVADAVAALSCEVARADASVFDLAGSGVGFSVKDETDIAGDVKMLLSGSKLVGANGAAAAFRDIPTVHGIFRGAVRALHARVRIELNSAVKVSKSTIAGGSKGKEEPLVLLALALQLATAIQYMCEISFARTKLCANSIADAEVRSKLVDSFGIDSFKEKLNAIMIDSDNVSLLRGVYDHVLKFRDLLAWEAAVALAAIEMDDSIEKPLAGGTASAKMNGENTKGDNKSEKKKKKKTLAKGASAVMELLRDQATNGKEISSVNAALVSQWGTELSLFFDPKDSHLESLIEKVKEIVESNEVRRLPKIPKGTRDFGKEQMAIREQAFSIIIGVFKMHGAGALDTPVYELRETLMGKYGEDSKLIYDLADQGGELCSLRYDLTVPFARYVAMNNLSALKRYQIAKVYRRDNPSKGRYREFYQCDFDIAGQYEPMEADFEVIKVLTELLDQLDIGTYEIKLNHRKLLDGMLEICGVPPEKFRTVCSSIDKLDKQTFEQIKKELVEEKGVSNETADKIGTLVKTRGPPLEVLLELRKEGSQFLENSGSVVALNELEILFKALEKAKALDNIVFDLSLARGLDYYTGVIYEAVFKGTTQVGSIAAGGRYDNLVGMFSGKQIPAVGVSLGIERVFTIMEQLEKDRNQVIRATETQVLVSILGKDLDLAAELVHPLWKAKIYAEFKLNKRVMNHISYAKQSGIPWMVLVGESEIQRGIVKLKNIEANQEEEVPRDKFVEELRRKLNSA